MMPSIDEIIWQIRKGNQEALQLLFSLFEKHIKILEKKIIQSYHLINYSSEDVKVFIYQDTIEILKLYEMDRAAFFSYWRMIIIQRLKKRLINDENENTIENSSLSVETELLDYYSYKKNQSKTLDSYIIKDDYQRSLDFVRDEFDNLASSVLKAWSQGYLYEEIAVIYNISLSQVTYIVHKSIKFLKKRFGQKDER